MVEIITQNDIFGDLHTHTIFSLHAFSTHLENIEFARKQNLKYLAFTDHYYPYEDKLLMDNQICRVKDTKHMNSISEELGLSIVPGIELNVGQDIPEKIREISWRPIGLHDWFVDVKITTLEILLKHFELAFLRGDANALAHIERGLTKLRPSKMTFNEFLLEMIRLCKQYNIPMELNESSLRNYSDGADDRMRFWLEKAIEENVKLYLGTDAHFCYGVGRFPNILNLLKDLDIELDIGKKQIINCNPEFIHN